MRPQIVHILTLLLSVMFSVPMLAQRTSPPAPGQRRPPELPLDDGALILLIIGVFVGVIFLIINLRDKEQKVY